MKFPLQFKFPDPQAVACSVADYGKADLRHDALAGLTVAVMGVPQAMAYALIAGLPPVYGLYTSIVSCIVAALSGSSNHLVTGPTNALCMVILSLTTHLPAKYGVSLIEIIFLLTLMTGLIQLAFGLLNMGGIVRYVSNSVVVGFTAGAGILIAVNQLKNVMGVSLEVHAERFIEVLTATLSMLPDTNLRALFIGLLTIATVVILKRTHPKLPGALLGVVVAGVTAGEDAPRNDEELGKQLARSFSRPISELAETDVPVVQPGDTLVSLIGKIAASRTTVLPVCDAERRILGLVDEGQVMRALAEALSLKEGTSDEKEDIVEVES